MLFRGLSVWVCYCCRFFVWWRVAFLVFFSVSLSFLLSCCGVFAGELCGARVVFF